MAMSNEELRKKYPMTAYAEHHWEIYDEVDARVVAVFYTEGDANEYLDFKNGQNK